MFKLLKYLLVICFVVGFMTPILVIESQRLVPVTTKVSPRQAQEANRMLQQLLRVNGENENLNIENSKIASSMQAFSYSIPNLDLDSAMSRFGWNIVGTYEFHFFERSWYVNLQCLFFNGDQGITLDTCYLGDLPLPGNSSMYVVRNALKIFAGQQVVQTFDSILRSTKIQDERLVVKNIDGAEIKKSLQAGYTEAKSLVTNIDSQDQELIQLYIKELAQKENKIRNLSHAIHTLSSKVKSETKLVDPSIIVKHNKAAIWALSIKYGSKRFAGLAGLSDIVMAKNKLTLRGRRDLALHFIYSALIQINSDSAFASGIGELKEVFDTNKGRSGFSFADLVADRAGVEFAKFMTDENNKVKNGMDLLAGQADERLYMPELNNDVEGLSESDFKRSFQSIDSPEYLAVLKEIDRRIFELKLYQG